MRYKTLVFRYKKERDGQVAFAVEKKLDGLGRIVLPKSIREYYGISNGVQVESFRQHQTRKREKIKSRFFARFFLPRC